MHSSISKVSEETLQFGASKCKSMLICKNSENDTNSDVQVDNYLGFVISNKGSNMANIQQNKNNLIGVIKKIFNKLNSMNLRQHYYDCSIIFLNVLLRPTILYACEVRQLECIEEGYLRKVLKTTMGCPIILP